MLPFFSRTILGEMLALTCHPLPGGTCVKCDWYEWYWMTGWWYTSWDSSSQLNWKKTCSKPPTRWILVFHMYLFNYSSGWEMEWNGMEWHGLRHILKNLMVELLTNRFGFKYYLALVLPFLQGSAWNSQQKISLWTTEWTFKKSYLMMSSQPQHGVSMTSASSLLGCSEKSEIWGVGWQPMLRKHTPRFAPTAYLQQQMLPWLWHASRTMNWYLINPNSKMLPEHTPIRLCYRSIPLTLKQLA